MNIQPESPLKTALQLSRKALIYVGIFSLFINLLMLTVPIYMLQMYDRVLASQSTNTLLYLTIIAVMALFIMTLLDVLRSRVLVRVSHWIDNYLSPTAFKRMGFNILRGNGYGANALKDIGSVRQFLGGQGIFSLFDAPWVPIYLLVIFMLNPVLGIIATIGAIILFVIATVNEFLTRSLLSEANKQQMENDDHIGTTLRNIEVIHALGMLPALLKRWSPKNERVLKLQTVASDRAGSLLSMSKFVRMMLQVLLLGIGALLVIKQQLSPGAMIAASIIMARALQPVEQAIGTWKQLVGARQSYKRLSIFLLQTPEDIQGTQLPPIEGELSFEHIIYVPPHADKPILRDIHFKVNAGEIVALVGPSGSGKSTLARLIMGIWQPTKGHVRVDGADVASWNRDDFGKQVGYLPQDVELFDGTVKDNIARFDDDATDEDIIAAAKLVNVHDMILHLPQGYETKLTPYNLSGGQRQRIALARAVYRNPKLLILDEPNSSLDRDGDTSLAQAIKILQKQGSTVVLVSHRQSIVSIVDKIFVLQNGAPQFYGPRDQVLAKLHELTAGGTDEN
tara:strand:+ start:736 stop:2430 length:1695 start_codon:yes stop_codon:yes gene_type:complete